MGSWKIVFTQNEFALKTYLTPQWTDKNTDTNVYFGYNNVPYHPPEGVFRPCLKMYLV